MVRWICVCVCVLCARSASADPIQITSGAINISVPPLGVPVDPTAFSGDRGFGFVGVVNAGSGQQRFPTALQCVGGNYGPTGCLPGTALSLFGDWNNGDTDEMVSFGATFDGMDFPRGAWGPGGPNTWNLRIRVNGQSGPLPEFGADPFVSVSGPFTFTGFFYWDLDTFYGPLPGTTETLIGEGVATFTLRRNFNELFPPHYVFANAQYVFSDPTVSAVPEPSSLLLLGPALLGVWRRRHCSWTLVGATFTGGGGVTTQEKGSDAGPSPAGP